jgi:hypothetical protein
MDNWKHRSQNMRCRTCIWFVPKENEAGIIDLGRCRKNAPTMDGFPVVFVNDWCGKHRLDENKVIEPTVELMPGKDQDKEDPWAKIDLLEKEILKARREKHACVQQIKVCTEHAARMATEENKEYWNGFNYGLCRALIELGVDQETVSKLIR